MTDFLKRFFASETWWHAGLILAWPALISYETPHWIFTPIGHIDPWINTGIMLDYPAYLKYFKPHYVLTRLSWIVPGFLAYKIFSPIVATIVLHLVVWYACVFALYAFIRITLNGRVAFIAAILIGSHDYFLYEVGTDYVYGANMAFMSLTCLMLLLSLRGRFPRLYLLLAGVFFAGAVHVNIYGLSFALPIGVLYLFLRRRPLRRGLPGEIGLVFAGFVALTVILGVINVAAGGRFAFYQPTIDAARFFTSNPTSYVAPPSHYWKQGYWLTFPAAAIIGTIIHLAFSRFLMAGLETREQSARLGMILSFLAAAAVTIGWKLKGWHAFYFMFYVAYALPFMFMALAAMIPRRIQEISGGAYLAIVGGLIAGYLYYATDYANPRYKPLLPPGLFVWALIAFAIPTIAGFLRGRLQWALVPTLVFLTAWFFIHGFRHHGYFKETDRKAGFEFTMKIARLYKKLSPDYSTFWWLNRQVDPNLPKKEKERRFRHANLYVSATALYIHETRMYMDFPNMLHPHRARFLFQFLNRSPEDKVELLLLSYSPDVFEKARKRVRRDGLDAEFVERFKVEQKPFIAYVTRIRVWKPAGANIRL